MKFHICTENPCELQDKECAAILDAGFTTTYTGEEENHVFDKVALENIREIKYCKPLK